MQIDDLRILLEENGLETTKIDEILTSIPNLEEKVADLTPESAKAQILKLQEAIGNETDWKKKASLAARLISVNLSTY